MSIDPVRLVVLVLLGVSGAWIGNLTALAPYKPYFVAGTLVFLGLGFWHVYFRPRPACWRMRALSWSGRTWPMAR